MSNTLPTSKAAVAVCVVSFFAAWKIVDVAMSHNIQNAIASGVSKTFGGYQWARASGGYLPWGILAAVCVILSLNIMERKHTMNVDAAGLGITAIVGAAVIAVFNTVFL